MCVLCGMTFCIAMNANAKNNYCYLVVILYYGVRVQKNIELFSNKIRLRMVHTPLHAFFPLYGHKHV